MCGDKLKMYKMETKETNLVKAACDEFINTYFIFWFPGNWQKGLSSFLNKWQKYYF